MAKKKRAPYSVKSPSRGGYREGSGKKKQLADDKYVAVRIPAALLDRIDRETKRRGLVHDRGKPNRSECIRQLLDEALR